MESASLDVSAFPVSKGRLWTGRILSTLAVLFLIFDGVTKVIKERHVIEAMTRLAYPESTIVEIGAILLVCTALYVIPQTSVLGAVLLTGYLGGAVEAQLHAGLPLFQILFPVIFGVVIWAGLFLREERLSALLPLRS
jgi:hypothetical protein